MKVNNSRNFWKNVKPKREMNCERKMNTFISNARLKLGKNQANAKQHPETELFLFENYSYSSSRHHPKIIGHILKNKQKNNYVCFHEVIRLIKTKMEMKYNINRYEINRPRSRYWHKYSKYKVYSFSV